MQYLKNKFIWLAAAFLIPSITHAEDVQNLKGLITYAKSILNSLIPLLFAIAFIVFIWGIIKYINAASPQKLGEARNYIIFGVLAITVMISVWGLATLIKNSFFESSPSTYTPTGTNATTGTIQTKYKSVGGGN